MREQTRQTAYAEIHSSHIRNFSLDAAFDEEAWRLILLPAYITTYRFQEKTYQLVINGQTGKVAGDKPVAWNKIWLIVCALVTPGLLIAVVGLLLSRSGAASFFFLGAIVFVIGALIAVAILQQANKAGEA